MCRAFFHQKLSGYILFYLALILSGCGIQETKIISTSTQNQPTMTLKPRVSEAITQTVIIRTKTPTSTPTTTPTLDIRLVAFSLDTANPALPDDIVEHLGYAGDYGGRPSCNKNSYQKPEIDHVSKEIELMQENWIISCGWHQDEEVEITIYYPDKSIEEKRVEVDHFFPGYTEIYFTPDLDAPSGKYSIEISGKSGRTHTKFNVRAPEDPRLYVDRDEQEVIFLNFQPNETVRLLAYEDDKFVAWQKYNMDEGGYLDIKFESKNWTFIAVGDETGEVGSRLVGWGGPHTIWTQGNIYCPEAPPPLRGMKLNARVQAISSEAFILFNKYNSETQTTEAIKKSVEIGDEFSLTNYGVPTCMDKAIWWHVACTEFKDFDCKKLGFDGLVPEGLGSEYYWKVIE